MSVDEPKNDVAISFLVQDISLAAEFHSKLSKSLSVFFFPHNQEELAGTDCMVSMREPKVRELFDHIETHCEKINDQQHFTAGNRRVFSSSILAFESFEDDSFGAI